ncbi:ATP-binding protein [Streptomyces sp. NPDC012600]|uniref:ATP-binding protein n=1 Tax=Streptomyces sp. NPDC012600 TaxID=3415005 RepID=UPI003C2AE5AE
MTSLSSPDVGLRLPARTRRIGATFPPEPHRVEHMRRLAAAHLSQIGGIEPDDVRTVQLLVSELVTNAIQHGCPGGEEDRIGFSLAWTPPGTVRIEVDDHSEGLPAVRTSGPGEEGGRGLFLVAAFADRWGRAGTRTWCTLGVAD